MVAYMDYSPASYLFLRVPRPVRRAKAVMHLEAPTSQLTNPSPQLRRLYEGIRISLRCLYGNNRIRCRRVLWRNEEEGELYSSGWRRYESVQSARSAKQRVAGRAFCRNAD